MYTETRIFCFIVLMTSGLGVRAAEYPTTRPYPGIAYRAETHADPPNRLFIAEIDLTNPQVQVRVAPGGPDPDGAGEWETTLMRPTRIAAREGFELVVNGDFFDARGIKDAEGADSKYRSAIWGGAVGPAVTDGQTWSIGRKKTPCLVVHRDRKMAFEMIDRPPESAVQVIAGNVMLVEDGKALSHTNKLKHPRTVVGLDARRTRLIILVVDGRKPGVSVGMSYAELAEEMIRLGCREAMNLDGGGSSVMAVREPAGSAYRILNQPTDGRERAVASVLGVSVKGFDPEAGPASSPRSK